MVKFKLFQWWWRRRRWRRRIKNQQVPIRSCPLALRQEPGCLSFIISMQDQSVSYTSTPLCACECACVHLCVCSERARKGPDCLQGPPRRWAGAEERLAGKGVCSWLCLWVCTCLCVLRGKRLCVCLWVRDVRREWVSQPGHILSLPPPSLPSSSPLIWFPHPSLCYSLIPSIFLSTLPPKDTRNTHETHTHTHTTRCLSFSDSSSRGPGACWWRLHRSFPSCGGGCTHMHTHAHANTRVHTHTQAS